ncbi:FUSC family protein [Clostridium sp. LY3-2]|uniref:FUSC family protein n=1 Tax=Clostridium sp. LY3-2 TaxID=2942482 RepID=UPI002153061C|nr:FUSC family protein [Clostridium sp. LY3-2]MCR6516150.1 FUSC family protein [Clostridium sp. LY3-2]
MKINFKKEIKKVINFILMLLVVSIFFVFGKDNVLIGFGTLLITSSFLIDDYSVRPKKMIKLMVFIQVAIGIFSYLASLNYLIGLAITIVVVFSLYYIFSYDVKPSKSSGFVMTYLFLLYSPITLNQLPKRLLALAFSGLVIMGLYYYLNKAKNKKVISNELNTILKNITLEVELVLQGKEISSINEKTNLLIKNTEIKIYEKRESFKKDVEEIYYKSIILTVLKNINKSISLVNKNIENEKILIRVKNFLDNIGLYINREINIEELKEIANRDYKELKEVRVTNGVDKFRFYYFKYILKEMINLIDNKEKILKLFKNKRIEEFKLNEKKVTNLSIRWNIAIKAAIVISLSVFVVNYFNIYFGKWIPFTMTVLILPYAEQSNEKIIERMSGTFLGVVLFEILNTFVGTNKILIIIALVVSIFLSININSYSRRSIFITTGALLSMMVIYPKDSMGELALYRILFNIIAAIVVALVLNFIFPYKINKDTKECIEESIRLNNKMIESLISNELNIEDLDKKLIMSNHYFRRLNYNNIIIKSDNISKFLSKQVEYIGDICFLFKSGVYLKDKELYKNFALKIIEKYKEENSIEEIKDIFNNSKSDIEKNIILSLYVIYTDMNLLNDLGSKCKKELI